MRLDIESKLKIKRLDCEFESENKKIEYKMKILEQLDKYPELIKFL